MVQQVIVVLGLTLDELQVRLSDAAPRAKLSVDELRLAVQALATYCLPSRIEHSGPAGGPIPLEQVHAAAAESLRQRLERRELLLRPPPPATARGPARQRLRRVVSGVRLLCRPVAPCCIFPLAEVNSRNHAAGLAA